MMEITKGKCKTSLNFECKFICAGRKHWEDLNKLSALGENSHTLNFPHVAHVFIRRNPMLL